MLGIEVISAIHLIEMGLRNGVYPDNKFTFEYHHATAIATRLLSCIMNLEKQVGWLI